MRQDGSERMGGEGGQECNLHSVIYTHNYAHLT